MDDLKVNQITNETSAALDSRLAEFHKSQHTGNTDLRIQTQDLKKWKPMQNLGWTTSRELRAYTVSLQRNLKMVIAKLLTHLWQNLI